MYKQCPPNPQNNAPASSVIRIADGACIPFDPANTDYQQFLKDIKEGVELLDVDGNTMSAAEAQEYIATLH